MTKEDRKSLLYFLTRTGMFINPVDVNNIVSFIHGYKYGSKNKLDFTEKLSKLLSEKYKIKFTNTSWPGQVNQLAKKRNQSWITIFRNIGLETLTNPKTGLFEKELKIILKQRITPLLFRINEEGDPWFNDTWKEEWLSLCSIKSDWFIYLWTEQELKLFKSIDKIVKSGNIYLNREKNIPAKKLVELKIKLDNLKKNKNDT